MKHGKMTRDQAIEAAGIETVNKLDYENCDFTNRVQTDGDTSVEFSASVKFVDSDGLDRALVAYYYQEPESLDGVEDLGSLDWAIEGYEIV
jgi:hypothetical protein